MKKLTISLFIVLLFNIYVSAQEAKPTPTPANQATFETPKKPTKPPETAEEFYEAARWVNWNERKTDEAVNLLTQAVSLKSDYVDAYYLRGILKQQSKNYKGAIEDFDIVIQQLPEAVNTYQFRAECKIALKDLRGALLDLDMSVSLLAAKGLVQYNAFAKRGKLKYLLKDYNGAIEDFTSADRMGRNIGARFYRGLTYLKKGDTDAAITDFTFLTNYYFEVTKEVRQKYPDQYTEKKEYPTGENPLATLNQKPKESDSPKIAIYAEARGGVAGCKGCPETKFAEFEDKIQPDGWFFSEDKTYLSPNLGLDDDEVIFYLLGDLLEKKGDSAGAIKAFTDSIIAKRYEDGIIRFRRGRLLLQAREFEPAIRDFSWTISENRNFAEAYLERGVAILMLGHTELAQKDFDIYQKLNQTPEAKENLNKRISEAKKLRSEINKTQSDKK